MSLLYKPIPKPDSVDFHSLLLKHKKHVVYWTITYGLSIIPSNWIVHDSVACFSANNFLFITQFSSSPRETPSGTRTGSVRRPGVFFWRQKQWSLLRRFGLPPYPMMQGEVFWGRSRSTILLVSAPLNWFDRQNVETKIAVTSSIWDQNDQFDMHAICQKGLSTVNSRCVLPRSSSIKCSTRYIPSWHTQIIKWRKGGNWRRKPIDWESSPYKVSHRPLPFHGGIFIKKSSERKEGHLGLVCTGPLIC